MAMNYAVILVLLAVSSGWAAPPSAADMEGFHTTLQCYGLLYRLSHGGMFKPDGSLNWNAACEATQAYIDCFAEGSGTGFTLDVNRVLNWQMCRANKVLKLCPEAQCDDLKKLARKTDYWQNLPFPASEGRQFKCGQPLHRECNNMYLDSLVNKKNMTAYYMCYVDGYKTCPARDLAPLTQTYREAVTGGSPVDVMFKKLKMVFSSLLSAHA